MINISLLNSIDEQTQQIAHDFVYNVQIT